ncbi:MAG: leucine-rich repeat domain-containing protein [Ruminococcaceae bacterium]|nr:leucine-rich repeat domain-containing protein [Oscillospiraceae bacterium]
MNFEQDNLKIAELFEFTRTENGFELKRYLQPDNSAVTEIEIPSSFRFVKVGSIAPRAFKDAVYLKSVTVPDTVRRIGGRAFENCASLESIALPAGLKITDGGLFNRCNSLRRVELPEGVDIIRPNTFSQCPELEEVVLPKGMCMLLGNAFIDCPKLRRVVFPEDNVITLRGIVFINCPLLPADVMMYPLIGSNDIRLPFAYDIHFDWDIALRRDVFELAMQYNSFERIEKSMIFTRIIDRELIELLPLASQMLDNSLAESLADYSAEHGKTEITAWLLNFKNGGKEKSIAEKIDEMFEL